MYLLGPTGYYDNKYKEYVYNNRLVKMGDTSIDLSQYYTKEEIDGAVVFERDNVSSLCVEYSLCQMVYTSLGWIMR